MKHFIPGKLVACDTETTGLDVWHGDRPFAFSFFDDQGNTAYFEWPVHPKTREVMPVKKELEQLREFFADERVTKVFHHAKFDVRMLRAIGIEVHGPGGNVLDGGRLEETMFMAHATFTLEPTLRLKSLADKYCEIDTRDQDTLRKTVVRLRRRAAQLGWAIRFEESYPVDGRTKRKAVVEADYWLPSAFAREYPDSPKKFKFDPNVCKTYALLDVERTMTLYHYYSNVMDEVAGTTYNRELELWPFVFLMEERGVKIDPTICQAKIDEYVARLRQAYDFLQKAAWKGYNPDSTQQTARLLFDKLRLEPLEGRAVDVDVLSRYRDHEVVSALIEYRNAHKAVGTYFGPYMKLAEQDADNQYILHTDFNQMGPATGRFSSRRPNLQNVAESNARAIEPLKAREPFGPRDGYVWLLIDWSNLELRIFADYAEEEQMLKWFAEGRDMHTEICNRLWGGQSERAIRNAVHSIDLDCNQPANEFVAALWKDMRVTPKNVHTIPYERRMELAATWLKAYKFDIVAAEKSIKKVSTRARTKMLEFLKVFGGGAKAASGLLKCSIEEARENLKAFDSEFPRVPEFARELTRQAKKDGYVVNRYGRRIAVDYDYPYRAINYIVQGSAADLMKDSMVKVGRYLDGTNLDALMLMTIHDELVTEFLRRHLQLRVVRNMVRLMEDPDKRFKVGIKVDVSIVTKSWPQKKRWTDVA